MKKLHLYALSVFLVSNSMHSASFNIFGSLFNGSSVGLWKWVDAKDNSGGTTREFQINPHAIFMLTLTGIVLYKLSDNIAAFIEPYLLEALPNIGNIEAWKKEHALEKLEKATEHEIRMRAIKSRRERLDLDKQEKTTANKTQNLDITSQEDRLNN